jgi:competence ComEA-like helix-hairpin-helix protein
VSGNAPVQRPNRFASGGWYLVLTILSGGFLAWAPFLHAADRLDRASLRARAASYGVLLMFIFVLTVATPKDAQGDPIGATGHAMNVTAALLAMSVMVAACVQQWALSREIYQLATAAAEAANMDPALAKALAARARRAEARSLAATDPLLAQDLHIGRPELGRGYDDGGLVDINNAPARTIATVCGIKPAAADGIVDLREKRGPFANVDEMLVLVDLPTSAWDRIRDRAIVID